MANKSTSIYKIFWFISCCLWASHVAAVDVLNQVDVLNSSASLVSRNGRFYLRFYNLSSMSDFMSSYSYLGIFYGYNTDRKNLIWIANRDRPITHNSGALVIDETGKLMITYEGDEAPFELYSGQSNNNVSAILQDDGNFVLKSGERILWQSFDFPTDCFLPGMKLGINYKTGQNWSLTSWLTDSIPAPGSFSLDWDPDEHQLILRRRGVTFWTSGVLLENSSKFENIALDAKEADHKFIEVSNEEGKYLTYEFLPNQYTPTNWINVTWLWLNFDGVMGDQSSNRGVSISDLCDGNSGALLCMILDILGDSGSVTGVDITRHRLAACRTLPQKLHPGSSLSSSSVGCSVSKCGNNSPRLIKPVFRGKSFIKKKVKQDPTSTSISSTQCYRSANNDLGPSTSNLDNYKRDCTVNKNERKENLKGSTASSSTNTSIEVNSSVAETSSSKAGFSLVTEIKLQ
ncbi:hypothetical protein LWI28_023288 [Acer negundo]|uniref:Bulb-type lectin domain-containing protein n=1 Tax=Acer negundo TaxID=4023 RepID=A0AAD5NXK4_ACENE|nr:hypothetical protein LWI28_023288 [Acer negundo]